MKHDENITLTKSILIRFEGCPLDFIWPLPALAVGVDDEPGLTGVCIDGSGSASDRLSDTNDPSSVKPPLSESHELLDSSLEPLACLASSLACQINMDNFRAIILLGRHRTTA